MVAEASEIIRGLEIYQDEDSVKGRDIDAGKLILIRPEPKILLLRSPEKLSHIIPVSNLELQIMEMLSEDPESDLKTSDFMEQTEVSIPSLSRAINRLIGKLGEVDTTVIHTAKYSFWNLYSLTPCRVRSYIKIPRAADPMQAAGVKLITQAAALGDRHMFLYSSRFDFVKGAILDKPVKASI